MPVPGNARHYAQIVKQNALLRRLLTTSQRIQKSVHEREGEPDQLVERAESLLFKVAHEERASDFRRVAEVLGDEIDRLEQLAKGDQTITGTPVRLPRPGREAGRVSAGQPDHRRGAALAR